MSLYQGVLTKETQPYVSEEVEGRTNDKKRKTLPQPTGPSYSLAAAHSSLLMKPTSPHCSLVLLQHSLGAANSNCFQNSKLQQGESHHRTSPLPGQQCKDKTKSHSSPLTYIMFED